jgi:glycosyltransferase involved in cell wall biosynthesis
VTADSSISVCHLLLSYYPQIGGTEIHAHRLARHQITQGLRVCVVAGRRLGDPIEKTWPSYEEIDGVPVYRVPIRGTDHAASLSYLASAMQQLVRLHRYYQVIHAHMISAPAVVGGLAGRLLRKKVVAKVSRGGTGRIRISDDLLDPGSLSKTGSLSDRIKDLWLKASVDRYLAISGSIAGELRQLGFPRDKVISIPNGIDVSEFAPSDEDIAVQRARLGLSYGPLLTYVGLLRPRKNLGVLIEALPLLLESHPDLRVALVGSGVETCMEEENRLRALQQELCLRDHVFFIEHTQEVVKYLQTSQVFVIPSYSEGLSNAMLEAMAVGLPIVATPISGAEDLIQDGLNGVLLPIGPTPGEVAQAIDALLEDADRAREMGRRARQTVVEHCSFEAVGEQILALYRELIGGR